MGLSQNDQKSAKNSHSGGRGPSTWEKFSRFPVFVFVWEASLNMPTIIMIVIKVMMVVMMTDDGGDDVNVDFDDLVVGDLVRNVIARLFYVSAVESSFVR